MCAAGTGQQVAELLDSYMMMMMMTAEGVFMLACMYACGVCVCVCVCACKLCSHFLSALRFHFISLFVFSSYITVHVNKILTTSKV
jgi:hypothetical protein